MSNVKKQDEFYTEFVITGFAQDPEKISQHIKINPTKILRIGDQKPHRALGITSKENMWGLESILPRKNQLSKHTNWLLNTLSLSAKEIIKITKNSNSYFGFIAKNYNNSFIFDLNYDLLSNFARYQSDLWLDIYFFGYEVINNSGNEQRENAQMRVEFEAPTSMFLDNELIKLGYKIVGGKFISGPVLSWHDLDKFLEQIIDIIKRDKRLINQESGIKPIKLIWKIITQDYNPEIVIKKSLQEKMLSLNLSLLIKWERIGYSDPI